MYEKKILLNDSQIDLTDKQYYARDTTRIYIYCLIPNAKKY
jgi:hypothetical protein